LGAADQAAGVADFVALGALAALGGTNHVDQAVALPAIDTVLVLVLAVVGVGGRIDGQVVTGGHDQLTGGGDLRADGGQVVAGGDVDRVAAAQGAVGDAVAHHVLLGVGS